MTSFKALWVTESSTGVFDQAVVQRDLADLPPGEVLIRVRYSSLNYRDALSANGNSAVTSEYPHIPGTDAAGEVVECTSGDFQPGDQVIVTGYGLGANRPGGFAQYIRVPAAWVLRCPAGMSLRESMLFGTAGLTAGLCIDKLEHVGLDAKAGPVLVTGACGGVGSVAVLLLTRLGYTVAASTGKLEQAEFLHQLGAQQIIDRTLLRDGADQPLLKMRWAGAVDTVGGDILFNVVKSLQYGASVTCCGLTASAAMNRASVLPFILRGVNLLGVDSVELPLAVKAAMWEKLAGPWKLDNLELVCREISLEELPEAIRRMLAGRMVGRMLVRID